MDETEFLRGLEGEEQKGTDLTSGAEHFLRLKKQVGLQQGPDVDLELEKEASLKDIGTAAKNFGSGAKQGLRWMGMGGKGAAFHLKNDAKAHGAGQIAGMLAPGAAIGGAAGYLAGRSGKEKKAEDKSKLVALLAKLKATDPGLLASMGAGAVGMGAGTYLASRPQKDTGKSKMEEQFDGAVAAQETKPERGLLQKIRNRTTEFGQGVAQAYREHPVKASLIGAGTGAVGGYQIGRRIFGAPGGK